MDRNGYRMVLRGIHLCKYGVVVTNGKELLHIDLPLPIEDLTIPFPHALLATKSEDEGKVITWCEKEQCFFRFEFGKWRWFGKALVGNYPDWHRVIPEQGSLTHIVQFDADHAAQLATFLKTVPDNQQNNPVTLSARDNSKLTVEPESGMRFDIRAEFPGDWGDLKFTVNKVLLLRLLGEGHRRIAIANDSAPFIAAGGIGRYLTMPLAPKSQIVQPQNQPKEEKEMNESKIKHDLTRSIETRNPAGVSIGVYGAQGPRTNAVKPERSEGVSATARNAAFSGVSNVTAPMPPVAPIINTEPQVNPLDDLAAAIDDFKSRIRAMFDESTILSRKVKEVALAQKQKERDFVQAKRALERIRMAI